jgi:hypothetical protein
MADFVAVLKNAIDGLGDDSPAMRARVYQRARATLAARLATVGPTPVAVAERQTRVLEDAIAEVESSYSDQADSDPIADLADVFAHPHQSREAAPVYTETTEDPYPTLQTEDNAEAPQESTDGPQESTALMNVASAGRTSVSQDLLPLAAPVDAQQPHEPITIEGPDFQIQADATASFGDKAFEMPASNEAAAESGEMHLSVLVLESAYQLGWSSSSVCGLCHRWALCIDQTHCWNRTSSS